LKALNEGTVYEFVFRGVLTDQALEAAGSRAHASSDSEVLASALSYDLLDQGHLSSATDMGVIYAALVSFENGVRDFITKVLAEVYGETWWQDKVQPAIRDFAQGRRDDDEKNKWHGTRSDDPINYTELKHLCKIMVHCWDEFEPYILRQQWVESLFLQIERSRNVVMHGGVLDSEDIERLGVNMRDWLKQVGG
jgi:hypothetical protein